jgi:hypothetical protein
MVKIMRIICLIICMTMIGTQVFAFGDASDNLDIKSDIEKRYGINIIIPGDVDLGEFNDGMSTLEKCIRRFPSGIIKEITDFYLQKGIVVNVIFDKTEIIRDLFSQDREDENSVNIYIKTLETSLYSESCHASEQAVMHELSHFISNYIIENHDLTKLKKDFDRLNKGYEYGSWGENYGEAFINKHAATSFREETADLIWYAEVNPSFVRSINNGNNTIIHEKIKLLAKEFDLIFDSITDKTKLWLDAIPQTPQAWAKGIIGEMKANLLIPDEYDGLYEAYIEREDFYKLMLNMIGIKAREKNLDAYFDLGTYEEHVALDPLKGEVYVSDGMTYTNYYNYLTKSTDALYQAMQMGIINTDSVNESQAYMTRVEIAKALVSIGNELGMDISDYEVLAYNDIDKVADSDKPYIYIAANKGLLRGDGLNFKPYDYCTYQEAYVILNRLYKSL